MKIIYSFAAAFTILMCFASELPGQADSKGFKAYLSVTTQGKALENKALQKSHIEDKLRAILISEGIQVIPGEDIEKHSEHYLYIYVTLKDSLNIHANMYGAGNNNSVMTLSYPEKSFAYKSTKDVTGSFRQYVREQIIKPGEQKSIKN